MWRFYGLPRESLTSRSDAVLVKLCLEFVHCRKHKAFEPQGASLRFAWLVEDLHSGFGRPKCVDALCSKRH